MSVPSPVQDARPWDARLLGWMSRGSAKSKSSGGSLSFSVGHGLVAAFLAALGGASHWLVPAIAYALLLIGIHVWRRSRRARPERQAGPNPFGQ